MDFDLDPFGGVAIFLGIVLVVSIVAGSLLMIAVSLLLLAVFVGLLYRARTIQRNLNQTEEFDSRD